MTMTEQQIKEFIVEKTLAGLTLSQIQDALSEQGVKIRFMELRMLAAESEDFLAEKRAEKEAAEAAAAAKKAAEKKPAAAKPQPPFADAANDAGQDADDADTPRNGINLDKDDTAGDNAVRGKTTVTISPIQRPGVLASGTVTFGSGVTADWYLDQTGRLGLSNASGQPDRQDIQEFQVELQNMLGA